MTGTTEAGQTTIIGERMNLTVTCTESPGMDAASLMVCTRTRKTFFFFDLLVSLCEKFCFGLSLQMSVFDQKSVGVMNCTDSTTKNCSGATTPTVPLTAL